MPAATEPADGLQLTVAVATRGRPQRLARLLDSLAAQTLAPQTFEVVIAVDGADPATEELLRERRVDSPFGLQAILRPRSGGPAAARNDAWRAGSAPLVAFTDDDCEATPGWLESLLGAARLHPGAVIQGLTRPNPADGPAVGPYLRTQRIERPNHWYQTCNIAYPRPLLERLGGFDERFTEAAGEDVDLGWRARAAGAVVEFTAGAVILHAVDDLGPLGYLRLARRGADSTLMFRLHPQLRRRTAYARIFWKRSHARLLLAATALLVARRRPLALLLALPYLKGLRGRARERGAEPLLHAPYLVLFDIVEVTTAVRGSIRHRVPML